MNIIQDPGNHEFFIFSCSDLFVFLTVSLFGEKSQVLNGFTEYGQRVRMLIQNKTFQRLIVRLGFPQKSVHRLNDGHLSTFIM